MPYNIAVNFIGAFATESMRLAIFDQNIYTVEPGKVQVRTFQVKSNSVHSGTVTV